MSDETTKPPETAVSAETACSAAVGDFCDQCGSDDIVIVKAYPDTWEAKDDKGGTDFFQDHDVDDAGHFAHACRNCGGRIVPGSHWIEP